MPLLAPVTAMTVSAVMGTAARVFPHVARRLTADAESEHI
jgi:hypothetical protein